jgi:uncharacterized membrane-anchored protein YhcB (DUF1043 family)
MNPTTLLILGTTSISFATYIYIVVMPNLESKINNTYLNIDQHISETRNLILMILSYELKDIRYQMDQFQRNIFLQINPSSNAISTLEEKMFNNKIRTTEGWSVLLTRDNNLQAKNEYETKIESIMKNGTLKNEEKIIKINIIRDKEVKRVNDKQKELEENYKVNKKSLEELKKKLVKWRKFFFILQIVGLIVIGISQLILIGQ